MFSIILENQLLITVFGVLTTTGVVGFVATKLYGFVLRKLQSKVIDKFLNPTNQDKIAEEIDSRVDALQKKNPEAGKDTRLVIIYALGKLQKTITRIIFRLKEADGLN